MRAMILAAGKGTRLAPLTPNLPKILVPVLGVPMLERLRAWLACHGVTELGLNTHRLAEMVQAHLDQGENTLLRPTVFHEAELLGTGGALVNAAPFWQEEPLLVWNGDVVCDQDPAQMMAEHLASGAVASLVVQERDSDSLLIFDGQDGLCGLDSPRRGGKQMAREAAGPVRLLAFNGISILSSRLRAYMPASGAFDLIDVLLDAVRQGEPVIGWDAGGAFYGTTGSPDQLRRLEQGLRERPSLLAAWTP